MATIKQKRGAGVGEEVTMATVKQTAGHYQYRKQNRKLMVSQRELTSSKVTR